MVHLSNSVATDGKHFFAINAACYIAAGRTVLASARRGLRRRTIAAADAWAGAMAVPLARYTGL